jgi:rhomboid protease GluP
LIIWGCIILYGATLLADLSEVRLDGASLRILAPSLASLWLFGASGSLPVFEMGRWWTIFSAGWLHGDLLHIAFNLVWLYQLSPPIIRVYGTGRFLIFYIFSVVTSSTLSSCVSAFLPGLPGLLQGAEISVGASGGVFGLLGVLVVYGQQAQQAHIQRQAFNYAVVLFVLGFVTSNVDNWGHLGGFLGGYGIAQIPGLNLQSPSVRSHKIAAIALLTMTALSIMTSLIHGQWLLGQSVSSLHLPLT